MKTTTIIRKGEKRDCQGVLALIQELAKYEKAEKEVTLTLEDLIEDGFGSKKLFHFFVAELNETIVGVALYYPRYSTWKGETMYLEDLIVREQNRRQNIGTKLFEKLIEEAQQKKVKRLEWQVLEWNTLALNFYKKFGAIADTEWINEKLNEAQIQSYS